MITKEAAYKTISKLIDRFEEQYDSYKNSNYNETLTRRDFIDPFFKALGWDIDNEQGYAEAYREVIHEDRVTVGDKLKAPDYSFKLPGGKRLFFVEAKKPSVYVKDEILPAYQVRRYGWSAKLPISIITDFEEFAIYDCTKKPNPSDKASVARIKYFNYKDYLSEFDFIWESLSKEKVLKGSFDKFVQSDTHKKGTATVDKEFLQSLDSWRTELATNISSKNRDLDEDEINFVVQQTIDRIIFLRIAEDRRIEPYGNLKLSLKAGDFYKNLFQLFVVADEKYNSGLFDFKKDKYSKALTIDNKVIKTIINELYYPESPYEFSVLSVEILGSAYEQFLGKQIKIDKAHRAKIEEKPEVRKAGGVYYTPQYIVEYIVKQTVGKLIEGKKPSEIEKIKILDPACGSGSFLIGAYQYLLDFHKDYYSNKGKILKGKKDSPLTPEGNLTTSEKKKILINNIFGVDIDVNAVEVTKLSLLLKCMEGETEASIFNQMKLFHERVLPTLDSNIRDGNSLIGLDFYNELDFGEEKKIKPFSWIDNFPEIFKANKGFDAVIGNPPYVDSRINSDLLKNYWKKHYTSSKFGKTNTYEIFIEKGLGLLNSKGKLGYIVPVVLLNLEACKGLRELLINNFELEKIAFCDYPVFEDANVDTMVLIIKNEKQAKNSKVEIRKYSKNFTEILEKHLFELKDANEENEFKIALKNTPILDKIRKYGDRIIHISDIAEFYNGIATGPDKEKYFSFEKVNTNYKPLLMGNNIGQYEVHYEGRYINYDKNKLHRPREESIFLANEKIVMQRVRNLKLKRRIVCTLDDKQFYTFNSVNNLLLKKGVKYNLRYLLALLNSNLLNFLLKQYSLNTNITLSDLELLPIRSINFNLQSENQKHDQLVLIANNLLNLNIEKAKLKLETQIDQISAKIKHFENKINSLVYELYDLTTEEINIVEKEFEK